MHQSQGWVIAVVVTFTVMQGAKCAANCLNLQPVTDLHLAFYTHHERTVDPEVNGTKWTLNAVGTWQRPAGGELTGYGVKLEKLATVSQPHNPIDLCEIDPSYNITTNNYMTFQGVEYGFLYQLKVRTVYSNNMQLQAEKLQEFSPDCYEETQSADFCGGREVGISGKPVDLRVDRIIKQEDGLIGVRVSWVRPVQTNGKVKFYTTMYDRANRLNLGFSGGNDHVLATKENGEWDPTVRYEYDIVGLSDSPDEYQINVTPVVSSGSNQDGLSGYTASLIFNISTVPVGADTVFIAVTSPPPRRRPPNIVADATFETEKSEEETSNIIPTVNTNTPSMPSRENLLLTASVAVSLALAFVIAMAVVACVCFRRKKKEGELKKAVFIRTREEEISMYHHKGSIKKKESECRECLPEFEVKELNRTLLKLEKELGSGQFGVVYKGYEFGVINKEEYSPVAVKSLKCNASQSMKEDFLDEIKLIIEIGTHPNILPVLGCCTVDEPYYLITEFMKYGDLLHFLWKCREENRPDDDPVYIMTETNKIQIARQITRGMEYLSNTRYYHGDLAARNVLVGDDLVVKISDFGLADDIYQNGYKRLAPHRKRPVKWVSLETNLEGKCTIQSDVWSFGIVLYEIYTLGRMPYPGIDGREVVRRLQTAYRMDKPDNCPDEIYDIMRQCWQEKPNDRPTFTNLFNTFDKMLVAQCDYMLPLEGAVYDHCLINGGNSGTKGSSEEGIASGSMATKKRLEELPTSESELGDTVRLFHKEDN